MERWGVRRWCTPAEQSRPGVLIHGSIYWFPIPAPLVATGRWLGLPGSRSPGVWGQKRGWSSLLTLLDHSSSKTKGLQQRNVDEKRDSISTVGFTRETMREESHVSMYACAAARLAYPKVMLEKCVRGSEEGGGESGDQQRICELCCISASRQSC